jgi:hypothetical protein
VDEAVEHLDKEAAAGFFVVFVGGEFGDGGDGAEVRVEDKLFDEGAGRVILRGGGAGGAGGGERARLVGEEASDDLEAVEEATGAGGVEVVGGDAAENLGGDKKGGGAVLDDGEGEGLGGVEVSELAGGGRGAAGGVVVVAELLAAQRGRTAAAADGEDVTALKALRRGFVGWIRVGRCDFGCVCHCVVPPRG